MKIAIYWIISVLFVGFIIFNATKISLSNPFADESFIALISIIALLCALILLWLLYFFGKANRK